MVASGRKSPEKHPRPHLIHRWMPVLDGLEAIKRLKSDFATAQVPVLALSAQVECPSPRQSGGRRRDSIL